MYSSIVALAANTPGADGTLFQWSWFIFNKYSTLFLKATWVTLYVSLIGTILGFILGFAVGIINTVQIHKEDNIVKKILIRILKIIVVVYVEIFRDTPMIVQGMVIYYGLRQNDIMITSIIAGILVTTLNTGAYMGETVRAGIKSVDAGQEEGALAMGMSHFKAMLYIIVPQALKNVIPEMCMGKREGYYFWDMDGRKFLDIHINGGTYNLGHRNKEIIGALTDAMTELDIGNHHFTGITKALLAEQLTSLCPDGLDYACFSTCGGEAVDLAIKSARYATQRKRVVSIQGCYHGHTGLSVSTGDARFKDPFLCQGAPGEFVQVPLNDLDAMEAELKKEDVACVIIESLLATYGFPIPDKGYLAGVKKLCEKYGTLYIADETQTGLMRTGKMWCFEHEGFVPDMITTAKGFGGGIYPISATVMNRKAASWMFDIGRMHGSTCGNSELGCVVAMKVLEISTRKETVDNINKNAKLLTERVNALIDKYDGFITGYTQRGVIMGINFDCEDASKTVCKPLFDNGVWSHNSRLHPNTLQLKLGLLCDDAFMDELFEKMDKGLAQALSK